MLSLPLLGAGPFTDGPGTPSAPTGLQVYGAIDLSLGSLDPTTQAEFEWTDPAGSLDHLEVYRQENGGAWTLVDGNVAPGTEEIIISGLDNAKTNGFRVIAVNAAGDSDPADITQPSPPATFSATAVSPTEIDLAFTDSPGGVAFQLYRTDSTEIDAGIPISDESYSDTGRTPDTLYGYWLLQLVGPDTSLAKAASATTEAAVEWDGGSFSHWDGSAEYVQWG